MRYIGFSKVEKLTKLTEQRQMCVLEQILSSS